MKRSTLWITGIATAIITVISLNAIFGMQRWRYYNHYGYGHYGYRHHGVYCNDRNAPDGPLKKDTVMHDNY